MFWNMTPLLRLEDAVDLVQGMKTNLTNRVFTDPVLNAACHRYINAQTVFAKMCILNTVDMIKFSLEMHKNISSGKRD